MSFRNSSITYFVLSILTACTLEVQPPSNNKENTESTKIQKETQDKKTTKEASDVNKSDDETPVETTKIKISSKSALTFVKLPAGKYTQEALITAMKAVETSIAANISWFHGENEILSLDEYAAPEGEITLKVVGVTEKGVQAEKEVNVEIISEESPLTIDFLNLPKGEYTLDQLRAALTEVKLNEPGTLSIQDNNGVINNIQEYAPTPGSIQLVFKAIDQNQKVKDTSVSVLLKEDETPPVVKVKKAILLGIDGVQYEKILPLSTPNFDRLTIKQAYTGGIVGQGSQQATSSGPGWSTILTGVWDNKHQVVSNSSGHADASFPSIFKRLKTAKPDFTLASIINWREPNEVYFKNEMTLVDTVMSSISDEQVTSAVVSEINKGTDFIFAHLDDPDGVGHSSGFGSSYNQSIITADRQLGEILDAIDASEANTSTDWLVLVTTDHGREASGYNHGAQTYGEKIIFIGTNTPLNDEFDQAVSPPNTDFDALYGYASQASLVPTILTYFDVPIDVNWLMDGPSLLGDLGVRKLMSGDTSTLAWVSESTAVVDIYKGGQKVATVKASDQKWTDPSPGSAKTVDYVVTLNGVSSALRHNNLAMTAIFQGSSSSKDYFFRTDNQYVRYSRTWDEADSGYPKPINNSNWPGLEPYKDKIIAGFKRYDRYAYLFLSDGYYLKYDLNADELLNGYPLLVNNQLWPGLEEYRDLISAALRVEGDHVYFFLSDGRHLLHNLATMTTEAGYPKSTKDHWPGVGDYADDIVAAIRWDEKVYFFLKNNQYLRYDLNNKSVDSGYPAAVDDNSWEGLASD